MDANTLFSIVSDNNNTLEDKIAAVSAVKAEVKRSYVDLASVTKYFEALSIAISCPNHMLQAVSFSCLCHLVKRIITQDPNALKEPSNLIIPIILSKLGDSKPSVRSTAARVFEDYWMACPTETEHILREQGLCHSSSIVRVECLKLLTKRIQLSESKFAFRPFTSSVVSLLDDRDPDVRQSSMDLLVLFFGSAHSRAKQDLYKELTNHSIDANIGNTLLKAIRIDTAYPPTTTTNSNVSHQRPASSSGFRPAHRKGIITTHTTVAQSRSSSSGSTVSTTSTDVTIPPNGAIFSTSFITDSPEYQLESIEAEDVTYLDTFRNEIQAMMPHFEGKETEHNWSLREKHVVRFRSLIRGNLSQEYLEVLVWAFKLLAEGICKAINSLRTSLAINGAKLVKETYIILGRAMDTSIEPFLSSLVKVTSAAKKITAQIAARSIDAMIISTSFSSKYLQHIQAIFNDKIQQPKVFAATWLRLILCTHHKQKSHLENAGAENIMEKCILKGLADTNPSVRESMRVFFWVFYEMWPRKGESLMNNLDGTARRHLERANSTRSQTPVPHSAPTLGQRGTGQPSSGIREFIEKSRKDSRKHLEIPPSSAPPTLGEDDLEVKQDNEIPGLLVVEKSKDVSKGIKPDISSEHQPRGSTEQTVVSHKLKTLSDMLSDNNDDEFISGLELLSFAVRGGDVPKKFSDFAPVKLPSPELVTSALSKAFTAKTDDGFYKYSDSIELYCADDIVGSTLQFVGTKPLISAIYFCLEEDVGVKALKVLEPVLIRIDAFIAFSSVLNEATNGESLDKPAIFQYAVQILQDSCLGLPVTDEFRSSYSLLENSKNVIEEWGYDDIHKQMSDLLDLIKNEYKDQISINPSAEENNDENLIISQDDEKEMESTNADTEIKEEETLDPNNILNVMKESRDLNGLRDLTESKDLNGSMDLNGSQDATITGEHKNGQCAMSEEENVGIQAEVEDAQKTDITIQEDVDEVLDNETAMNSDNEEAEFSTVPSTPRVDSSPERADTSMPSVNTSSMSDLQDDVGSKLAIFEDPEDVTISNKSNIRTRRSWIEGEIKKENCISPLPQKDSDASHLFDNLLFDLENKTLTSHGFRKLLTIVKGARFTPQDSPAFKVWKGEKRLSQLKTGLLDYLNSPNLTESQINMGLLQLNQLLTLEREAFCGLEGKILNSLMNITRLTTSALIGFGVLAEARNCLVKSSMNHKQSRDTLMEALIDKIQQEDLSKETRMFLIKTMANVFDVQYMSDKDLEKLLPEPMSNIMKKYIGDEEVEVRREAYSLLVKLKHICKQGTLLDKSLRKNILDAMSSGQQQLLEHLYRQSENVNG